MTQTHHMAPVQLSPSHPSIIAALQWYADATPNKLAVRWRDTAWSYAVLADRAAKFAGALLQTGFARHDRVALFMENSVEFLIAYFGTWLARGTVVLINNTYRQTELRHILSDSGARVCVTGDSQLADLETVRAELPHLKQVIEIGVGWDKFLNTDVLWNHASLSAPDPDDTAIIAYTSGTTGRSKGALLLHRNIAANAHSVCEAWQWSADDHLLLMLPLFHVHGLLVGISGTVMVGASCELHKSFVADLAANRLASGEFSLFFGVPTMYTRLIVEAHSRHCPNGPNLAAPGVRLFVSGSAPLSPQTFAEFERVYGHQILERYGMTETGMNLTNPYTRERRPGTVGGPFPRQQARIVDLRSQLPVAAGVVGEIQVRGAHVFAGYLNQIEATAASFTTDGWFKTGDLGCASEDGYYTITGRAKELIITGGYNVYPREVEEVLTMCPGVREAAVFGLPDPEFGERVCAALVCDAPEPTSDEVIAHCKLHLASFKKPRQVFVVSALPRNAMGKVVKGELAAQFRT